MKTTKTFIPENRSWCKLDFFIVMLILTKIEANNIENFSTYKRMDLYKLESSYPDQFCPGFVCEKSGLSQVRIVQILDKENQMRNDYASLKSISNMFHVDWNKQLARFARRKALLCIFPTNEHNLIFETRVFDEWYGEEKEKLFPNPVAIEVVMGYRVMKINKTSALYLYDELADELSDFFRENNFNKRSAIRRRGSVLNMGCDYVVRNNGTHILTHLVCAYGILYFANGYSNDYAAIVGTPCSDCSFYKGRPYFRRQHEKPQQHWACLSTFAYLCGDVSLPEQTLPEFRYDCGRKSSTTSEKDTIKVVTSKNLDENVPIPTSPPYEWPCYKYAIPVILLISIMFVVVSYQFFSIIVLKLR